MSHTEGPWVGFGDQGKPSAILPAMRDGAVCEFSKPPTEPDFSLMIAAPELMAVCKMILKASMGETRPSRGESSIGWQRGDGVTADQVKAAARAAIAKAEFCYAQTMPEDLSDGLPHQNRNE